MTKQQAIDHISNNRDKTFLVRPVTFHGFAILQIVGENTAETLIQDLTQADAYNVLYKGLS